MGRLETAAVWTAARIDRRNVRAVSANSITLN